MDLDQLDRLQVLPSLPDAVISVLRTYYIQYPRYCDIRPSPGNNEIMFDVERLTVPERLRLISDLGVLMRNPDLPLENITNYLDTYKPETDSQRGLLSDAQQLLDSDSSSAGLFVYGFPGVGKTHVAVGLAKEFMARGFGLRYVGSSGADVDAERGRTLYYRTMREAYARDPQTPWHFDSWRGTVSVFDDLLALQGDVASRFKDTVLRVHERGGRILVTSNVPYDSLMEGFMTGEPDRERVLDRMHGIFKVVHVEGSSQRPGNAWHVTNSTPRELR